MFKEYFDLIVKALVVESIDESISYCKKANSIIPKHSFAYILLILFYIKKYDLETAKFYNLELSKHNPNFNFPISMEIELPLTIFILKQIVSVQTIFNDATLEKYILNNQNSNDAFLNVSVNYLMQNDINNANRIIDCALEIFPEDVSLKYNKSAVLMKSEKLEEAWECYELREKIHKHHGLMLKDVPKFDFQKENINLLVYAVAGYGDTIFYSRYLNLLKEKNINLFIYVQPALRSLYRELGFNVVEDINSLKFDYQISFMSLANLFKTSLDTIPFSDGYINLKNENNLLNISQNKKIGLVWRSGSRSNRTLELSQLKNILSNKKFDFYSLQKEVFEDEKKLLEEFNVVDLSGKLTDFKQTALYINDLDFVIGCDTAVTNLSAAMNKKTCVLLPHFCDFRWGISEFWTPWYNSVEIYRQVLENQWKNPIELLEKQLNSFN